MFFIALIRVCDIMNDKTLFSYSLQTSVFLEELVTILILEVTFMVSHLPEVVIR